MSKLKSFTGACALLLLWATLAPAQTFTTLHNLAGSDGAYPWDTLVQAADGNLYGTTQNGGSSTACATGCGTIFKISLAGALTTLHSFNRTDGWSPLSELAQNSNGDFYGVTAQGGANDVGTVFKITSAGSLTTLYSFNVDTGYGPQGALILGTDGNFYGTSTSGGPPAGACQPMGCGTIFKITPAGIYTTIHNFNGIPDGGGPLSKLVQAPNGKFYGTASDLGTSESYGTVYTITPGGTYAVVHQFNNTDGAYPFGGLILATDGNFYGQTDLGGASSFGAFGTVYKMTPNGQVTTLHSFEQTDGDNPVSNLVQGSDGSLYGTASYGGMFPNFGTIFKIAPGGKFTTLHNFASTDGAYPYAGLLQDTNGSFYGDTFAGGFSTNCNFGCGTIFSMSVGLKPFVRLVHNSGKVGQTGGILGQGFTGSTSVLFNGVPATFTVHSNTYLTATVPSGATTGFVTVTTPNGKLTSNIQFHVLP